MSSACADGLLSRLAPELQHDPVIHEMCVQGHFLRIYRIQGQIDMERVKSKVASIAPPGSPGDIGQDLLLAQWTEAHANRLVVLWRVAERRVEGIFSTLINDSTPADDSQPRRCATLENPAPSMLNWIKSEMGLRRVFLAMDPVNMEPSYTHIYSTQLTPLTLTKSTIRSLRSKGWNVVSERGGNRVDGPVRSLVATQSDAQLVLKILSVQGVTMLYVIGQRVRAHDTN